MTQQHPISPPQWQMDAWRARIETMGADVPSILLEVAQWGADQELEAFCEWASQWVPRWPDGTRIEDEFRAFRRPKPPSLKEQAMQALCRFMASEGHEDCTEEEVADDFTTIRRALEQLDD